MYMYVDGSQTAPPDPVSYGLIVQSHPPAAASGTQAVLAHPHSPPSPSAETQLSPPLPLLPPGTLDGLRQHLATSQPDVAAAWLALATTQELARIASLLSTPASTSADGGHRHPQPPDRAPPSPALLELVTRAALDRASPHAQPASPSPSSHAPPVPLEESKAAASQHASTAAEGSTASSQPAASAAASARDLASLALALAQGGSSDPGLYLRLGDQLAAARGFTRLGVNQLVNAAAAFAMAGMAHSTLLDAVAEAVLPGSAGEKHFATMPQLATLAGAYAQVRECGVAELGCEGMWCEGSGVGRSRAINGQLSYSHRPLLDSIATKFLALSDRWGPEDAEHVASIAAACAQLQLDRPRVYITALTYTTDHAMEMSSAGLLKLLRAAAHVTAPHNQGSSADNAGVDDSTPGPALTVTHPHQLHGQTGNGGVFYSIAHPGASAPVVRSPLDGAVSARSTGASMLDIHLQPAFASTLGRFVTKACQLLKHDLPDLQLQELALIAHSCASLSQLQPSTHDSSVHTGPGFPSLRTRGSSSGSGAWDISSDAASGAESSFGSGGRGSEGDMHHSLEGGRPTQGGAASARIRAAAADPVFLQQLEGSAVALAGSHASAGGGEQLPVLAQMLVAFSQLGHTASVLGDATSRLLLQASQHPTQGLSAQPTETVLQLLSGFAWRARSEQQQQQQRGGEDISPLPGLPDPEHLSLMQALCSALVPRFHTLQPVEVLGAVQAAGSLDDSSSCLPPDILSAVAAHVSAERGHSRDMAAASPPLPLVQAIGNGTSGPLPETQLPHSTSSSGSGSVRKPYTAAQLCNLIQALGPSQVCGEASHAAQHALSLVLGPLPAGQQQQQQQSQSALQARPTHPPSQQPRRPFPAAAAATGLSTRLVCAVAGVSARQRRLQQQGQHGGWVPGTPALLDLLAADVTQNLHSHSPAAMTQLLQAFSQVPGYTHSGLTDALAGPLTRSVLHSVRLLRLPGCGARFQRGWALFTAAKQVNSQHVRPADADEPWHSVGLCILCTTHVQRRARCMREGRMLAHGGGPRRMSTRCRRPDRATLDVSHHSCRVCQAHPVPRPHPVLAMQRRCLRFDQPPLCCPDHRWEAMEDMGSDTWLSTSLALSALGHRQERTFEVLAARGVKLVSGCARWPRTPVWRLSGACQAGHGASRATCPPVSSRGRGSEVPDARCRAACCSLSSWSYAERRSVWGSTAASPDIRAHMPPSALLDAMAAYTSANVYSKALFNALARYCVLQLPLFTPAMTLRLLHQLSDAQHRELETVMVLARNVRDRLAEFSLQQLMGLVTASLRLQVYHGQLYRDIARRYLAETSPDSYVSGEGGGSGSHAQLQRQQWAGLHNLVVAYGMSHHKDPEIVAQLAQRVLACLRAQQAPTPQQQASASSCSPTHATHTAPALHRPHAAAWVTSAGHAGPSTNVLPGAAGSPDKQGGVRGDGGQQASRSDAALLFAQELAHMVWVVSSSGCRDPALMQAAAATLAPLVADTQDQRYTMRIAQAYASAGASEPLLFAALRTRVLRLLRSAEPSSDAGGRLREAHATSPAPDEALRGGQDPHTQPRSTTCDDSASVSDTPDDAVIAEEHGSLTVSLVAAIGLAHAEAKVLDAELASVLACYCSAQAGGLSIEQLNMMAGALGCVAAGFCVHSDPAFPSSRRDAQAAMLAVKEVTRVKSRQVADAAVAQALSARLCRMSGWDEDFGRVGRSLASRAAAAVEARKSFRRMWQYPKFVF
ncbi:MAG: hypothetical protein WDW38_007601 [Sanguina aurantia]